MKLMWKMIHVFRCIVEQQLNDHWMRWSELSEHNLPNTIHDTFPFEEWMKTRVFFSFTATTKKWSSPKITNSTQKKRFHVWRNCLQVVCYVPYWTFMHVLGEQPNTSIRPNGSFYAWLDQYSLGNNCCWLRGVGKRVHHASPFLLG